MIRFLYIIQRSILTAVEVEVVSAKHLGVAVRYQERESLRSHVVHTRLNPRELLQSVCAML